MKKILLLIAIITFAAALIWVSNFYWQHFRGVWPAIKEPAPGIVEANHEAKVAQKGGGADSPALPLKLPPGFAISIFARLPGGGRVLTFDPQGNLLVSIPSQEKVLALPDKDHDGKADQVITVIEGLNRPHGLAFRRSGQDRYQLYIGESHRVIVCDYDQKNLRALNPKKIIDLPDGGNHYTRTLLFMPPPNQDKLLISVGSSCNVCEEKDWRRAKVLIADSDGGNFKIFASGLRNAVFMTAHPVTQKIWATEMGRDFLGDETPPDEINILEEGKDYGWPYCYGKKISDSAYEAVRDNKSFCARTVGSHIDIPAHSAPLGLAFFPKEGWPAAYRYNLLVAYHGSWNRSVPTGYKIVRFKLDEQGNYLGKEDFITGWMNSKYDVSGRPVDILILPNGVIYVSDDKAKVVYRVVYRGSGFGVRENHK